MNRTNTIISHFTKVNLLHILSLLTLSTHFNTSAQILQHFDASVNSLVLTDANKLVTSWLDKSGNNYHAIPATGSATFPSLKTFDTGLHGIDFRDARISLELLSAAASDTILKQDENATGFYKYN